jgi:hypothetical protein
MEDEIEKIPSKLYLQLDGDGGDEYLEDGATHCDKRVFDTDVVYTRDTVDLLQRCYDTEINFEFETFWDAGVTVTVTLPVSIDAKHHLHTTQEYCQFDTVAEAVAWLAKQCGVE